MQTKTERYACLWITAFLLKLEILIAIKYFRYLKKIMAPLINGV